MSTSENYERFIRVAVELLQTQNPRAVLMLRNFLTYIPSATSVKHILKTAITELIDTAPMVICWLLEHSEPLQPEINITNIVTQTLSERLLDLGFVPGQDFNFGMGKCLAISEAAKAALAAQSQLFNIQNPLPIIDHLQNK
jgi:hypothetical protein